MSTEALLTADTASIETLRAALAETQAKLRSAVALGNDLYDEREKLSEQVQLLLDRESHSLAAHKREVGMLTSNAAEARRERDSAQRQLLEAQEEVTALEEQLKRSKEEIKNARSTNNLLRDDFHSKERENDTMRKRSVMQDTVADENEQLKAKISELERSLQQSRATVSALQAQRNSDRDAWQAQTNALRDKNTQLAAAMESMRKDAAAEVGRLRAELTANRTSTSPETRKTGVAPSVPNLNLALAESEASVEYDALTARTRGRSMARLAADQPYMPVAASEPSTRLMRRRRNSDLEEEDGNRSMARFVSATPAPTSAGATHSAQDYAPSNSGSPRPNDHPAGPCYYCGRSDPVMGSPAAADTKQATASPSQDKKDDSNSKKEGCPCLVM